MADSENKPRDIKNLKERLGRAGSSPGQSGRAPSMPPGTPPIGGAVRAPSFPPTGSRPPVSPFGAPPASGSGVKLPSPSVPSQRPPGSLPIPGAIPAPGSGILAPPFMAAQQAAAAPAKPIDPFAAAAPGTTIQKQQVTLVVDESAIAESQTARRSRRKNVIILGVGALVGIAVGFMVGSTAGDRSQYNSAVRDGKEIYKSVNEISKSVDQAQAFVKTLFAASSGGPGRKASIDYASVEGLVALKKPVSANAFHRKRYLAFQPGTVDDLFDYYNNINILWDKFIRLGVQTAGKNKREALEKAAAATDEMLNNEYGMVMFEAGEDAVGGGLVYVTIPPEGEQVANAVKGKGKGKKSEDSSEQKVLVSTSLGGVSVEKVVFAGQADLLKKPGDYVIMLDKFRSKSILGAPASIFGEFRGNVSDINGIMIKTVEVQGRLLKALGEISSLTETMF